MAKNYKYFLILLILPFVSCEKTKTLDCFSCMEGKRVLHIGSAFSFLDIKREMEGHKQPMMSMIYYWKISSAENSFCYPIRLFQGDLDNSLGKISENNKMIIPIYESSFLLNSRIIPFDSLQVAFDSFEEKDKQESFDNNHLYFSTMNLDKDVNFSSFKNGLLQYINEYLKTINQDTKLSEINTDCPPKIVFFFPRTIPIIPVEE